MLHVIAIVASILFIVILIVSIIIFIIINGKSNVDNVPQQQIVNKNTIQKKRSKHRKVRSCKTHKSKESKRSNETNRDISRESNREFSEETSNILDVCNYSKYTVYLLEDHSFQLQENEETRMIKCDLRVKSIVSFEGHLYALANGKLYKLDNNTLESNTWVFTKVTWSPESILDISVPHDKSIIWIRCRDNGYVHNTEGEVIESVKSAHRRVYGMNSNNYITLNNGSGVLQPNNEIVNNVRDAVITHEGELFTLSMNDKYKMIKMIDWKPYYII